MCSINSVALYQEPRSIPRHGGMEVAAVKIVGSQMAEDFKMPLGWRQEQEATRGSWHRY